MFNRPLYIFIFLVASLSLIQTSYAQDLDEDRGFIFEEEIEAEFLTELEEKKSEPRFIITDILTQEDVEPAIVFYIRDDINRKFSGLITNLKLEKIYGVFQEDRTATVYFDYSYTSLRNIDNVLYERGKMTLMKFNSGKWFNAELSIYLMDSYPIVMSYEQDQEQQPTE
jgi:hypothetical protein